MVHMNKLWKNDYKELSVNIYFSFLIIFLTFCHIETWQKMAIMTSTFKLHRENSRSLGYPMILQQISIYG